MSRPDIDAMGSSVWDRHATQWSRVSSPLRPTPEDVRWYEQVVSRWAQDDSQPRIAVWGVTPEIVGMQIADGADLIAIDRNQVMLELFSPALGRPGARGVCADWHHLPLATGSCDLVLGDGCFAMSSFPLGFRSLARSLRRVLSPNGAAAFRFYLRPEDPDSLENLVSDLRKGRIGSFHAFKLRAAMALQETPEEGIEVARVFDWWAKTNIKTEELTALCGWHPEIVSTIDAYRDRPDVYYFPTLGELRRTLGDLLVEVDCHFPGYELGERCALIELRAAEQGAES